MGLFDKSKESVEYTKLESFNSFLESLLLKDAFISRKQYIDEVNKIKNTIDDLTKLNEKNVLLSWCKQNRVNFKKLSFLLNNALSFEKKISIHNEQYILNHLKIDKEYLDNVLKNDDPNILLDDEQRRVVLSDEDYTLVIAGAGAGKTTTIEAKAKYLVEKKNIDPSRILIVSFTRKATNELKERFKKLNIPVDIATFHSIGNTIIKENDGEKYKIVTTGFMYRVIQDWFINKLDDEYFIKKIMLFFASYLNIPFEDEKNITLLYKRLSQNDLTTLKEDLKKDLNEFQKEQARSKITLNSEKVRSIDECRIANFLFINGIEYEYEPVYQHCIKGSMKPYTPDFAIKYNGETIYLEHFGISESGENNRFTKEELEEYKKHVNDKVRLHKEHKTKLIYTFSKYNDGRDLITHLKEKLEKVGITLNKVDQTKIYKALIEQAQDKYFYKLIMLICNFINRFKVNNYDPNTKFDEWQYAVKNERTKLFIEIAKRCFMVYESRRLEEKAIDFEDMINNAINILHKRIVDCDYLPYDYIFVDEYQDISIQRFDLCKMLSEASKAKIVAVGDDWQSIYKFSGSKIELFTDFKEKMGYADILKITSTHRNSQELIDVAGQFVMANEKQIKKELKSNKHISDPVILMTYDDSNEKDDNLHGPFYRLGETIEKTLDDIVLKSNNKDVLFIGRYNFEGAQLGTLTDFFYIKNNRLKSKKYPDLDIEFLTAHSSKGLGYSNVVIINGKDDVLGFPSKIEDDPVMKLVIPEDENLEYEEERRLFYVALTRTKNRVYVVVPKFKPSKFVLELNEKYTSVIVKGEDFDPMVQDKKRNKCPVCGYPLQYRHSRFKFLKPNAKLWICSNDPEVCGFLTNDLNGNKYKFSISKCPKCIDGYLIVKPIKNSSGPIIEDRILGCTNYKRDGSGCNCTMQVSNYTQNFDEIIIGDNGKIICDELKVKIVTSLEAFKEITNNYPSFNFTINQYSKFLMGESTKAITSFKLDKVNGFGIFKDDFENISRSLIEKFLILGLLTNAKDKNGYEIITLGSKTLNDETLIRIIRSLRLEEQNLKSDKE